MNFDHVGNPAEAGPLSTPAMASTFSLLMKIVRDLALNRDDPEGREHHKHFVEQQFRNSDARMHRVINECSNDLTTLIQLFDLVIRRVDRSRREVSACLFSIRNCKQLLLLRRAECRRLWFQSNEQKALVRLYDQLIGLKAVRQRCRHYVCLGYLVHAACLVERAIEFLTSEDKRLRQQWRESESDEYQSSPMTQADHKLLKASDRWSPAQGKLTVSAQEPSEDCLSQLRAEMSELGGDLLTSLRLALELCLFESQSVDMAARLEFGGSRQAETWSSQLVACWRDGNRGSQFLSFEENGIRRSRNRDASHQPAARGIKAGSSFYALPEPLSFETDRSSLANTPSLCFILNSKEASLRFIMEAAGKLTHIPDAMNRLLQHLMEIMPRRLDHIAVKESASVMLNSTSEPMGFVEKSNPNGVQETGPKQCRSLAVLLSGMFDKYDQIAKSCKLLFSMDGRSKSSSGPILPYVADYHYSMSCLWSMVQRPLTAVLLAHLITDLATEVQKTNIAVRHSEAGDADSVCFNSNVVLEAAFRYHRIKSAETTGVDGSSGISESREASSAAQDPAVEDMSFDLDRFFFDPGAIGSSSAIASSAAVLSQSGSYKLPTLGESPQNRRTHSHGAKMITKSGQGRLFRFDKSAQVQSLSQYYQDVSHNPAINLSREASTRVRHFEDTDAIVLGIKSVIVCEPSYRNVHAIYSKLNHICDLLEARVKDDCYQQTNNNAVKGDNDHLDGSHDIHLTLFKDTIFEFVKDIFVVQLRNDVRKKMSEGLPPLLRPTELLPLPIQRRNDVEPTLHSRSVPILFYTFLSMQAVDELLAALFDMPVHCGGLWIAINEIVLQHRASSTNLFTSTLLATPLSVEWVRDVDVNRHLRSMPALKKLLTSGAQPKTALAGEQTVSFDPGSARRKTLLLTAGRDPPSGSHSFSLKEAETILLNLTKEELNTSERMITDYRQTRLIAHQHESLTWFVNEFRRLVVRRQADGAAGPTDRNLSNRPESEAVMSSVFQTGHLAEDILLVLFVEVRVHCFYHLILLANPGNLLQYAARPASGSVSLPFRPHWDSLSNLASSSYWLNNFDSVGDDTQSACVSEDSTIQSLVRDLFRLQESLIGALSIDKIDFLFDGLGYLIATVFIELVGKLSLLDEMGLLKMRRNILSVHNCLLSLVNQRRQHHANLVSADEDGYSLSGEHGKRLELDYAAIGKIKRFHQLSKATDSDSHELLRALHFYDLLTCSNVDSLLDRIQHEFKRGHFRRQDYSALVSLKYRMDTGAAKPDDQLPDLGQNALPLNEEKRPPDLQSVLDKLEQVFERASTEKSMSNVSSLANSSI